MSTIRAQRAPRVRAALMRRRKAAAEFISFFAEPASSPQVRKASRRAEHEPEMMPFWCHCSLGAKNPRVSQVQTFKPHLDGRG